MVGRFSGSGSFADGTAKISCIPHLLGLCSSWQREIAFWNIGIVSLVLCYRSLHAPDAAILPALALLSLLLGTNHLLSGLKEPNKAGHWAGVLGNFVAIILYIVFVTIHHIVVIR